MKKGAGRGQAEGGAVGTMPWRRRRVVARPSEIDARVARAWHGWIRGRGRAIWPQTDRGSFGALSFGTAHRQASLARWPAAAARDREGREERGRERENG
jgi:hypothetical protein